MCVLESGIGASGKEQSVGSAVREPAQPARILPGTPMRKVIPPRMVGPYMSGQRGVIAGYVHRVRDVLFRNPADAFYALGLGYEGSDFKPDMTEMYFLCWQAREIDGYVPVTSRSPAGPGPVEFYLEPIQIPVGTTLCRLADAGEEPVARYDGLAWRRPAREG
jgi:hypothetical protein